MYVFWIFNRSINNIKVINAIQYLFIMKKYGKPTSEVVHIENEVMYQASGEKPGHGWGTGGHSGPPGQKHDIEDPDA